jgi:hypothetical protein
MRSDAFSTAFIAELPARVMSAAKYYSSNVSCGGGGRVVRCSWINRTTCQSVALGAPVSLRQFLVCRGRKFMAALE